MATITKRIEVCDVCRDMGKTDLTRFRIAIGHGRLRTYALCGGDSKDLRAMLSSLGSGTTGTTPGRPSKMVTMAQIETVKATQASPDFIAAPQ